MSQFLRFSSISSISGKTVVVNIRSQDSEFFLGSIQWYRPWRKYCFYPSDESIFDVKCLNEIVEYINKLMEERKNGSNLATTTN